VKKTENKIAEGGTLVKVDKCHDRDENKQGGLEKGAKKRSRRRNFGSGAPRINRFREASFRKMLLKQSEYMDRERQKGRVREEREEIYRTIQWG